MPTLLCTLTYLGLISSCGPEKPFSGGFEYRNSTWDELYIVGLSRFKNPMASQGPGRLGARGKAAMALQPMYFPPESVLTWKDARGVEKRQTLWSQGSLELVKNKALVLEYTSKKRWKVFFEKIDYL